MLIVVILGAYLVSQGKQEESPLKKGSKALFDLEAHWAQGNMVSLVRHTERCDRSDGPCFDGKDGITVIGKEQAIKIGEAYTKLPKQDITVYNSPLKRTKQSANLMFPGKSTDKKWLRDGCKENLLDDIIKYKEEAKNLILVTHDSCIGPLGEHQGDKLLIMDLNPEDTYGASFFLTINKEKSKANFLGYLPADAWEKLYE
jgi:phosphohistidine phosphatase SixA